MGYGIKLLITPSCMLPLVLQGEREGLEGWKRDMIERHDFIEDIHDKLFRLGYTINFIANCKTVFLISADEEDEHYEIWDNIYTWKNRFLKMEWEEVRQVFEPLIEEQFKDELNEEEKKEILGDLEILFSAIHTAKTFTIY
jgi:hypothetical protein